MNEKHQDYWMECISEAADECNADLSESQLECIAESVAMGHECYGQAFYAPPPTDRVAAEVREWKSKYDRLQQRFDDFRDRCDKAIKNYAGLSDRASYRVFENGDLEVLNP